MEPRGPAAARGTIQEAHSERVVEPTVREPITINEHYNDNMAQLQAAGQSVTRA